MPGLSLFDMLSAANDGAAINQVSQQSGLEPDMAQTAIKALLPAIAGGLQRNVQQPGGLESLLGALQGGDHAKYLDQPQSLSAPETIADGNAILGHLLGSKDTSRAVASRAAQKTGLGEDLLKQLLPVVAAMAMGSLSKQSKNPDVVSALSGVLGGAPQQGSSAGGSGRSSRWPSGRRPKATSGPAGWRAWHAGRSAGCRR